MFPNGNFPTVFDGFYNFIILMACFGLAIGRVLHLILLWWKPSTSTKQTQRKRYMVCISGVLTSGGILLAMLIKYSPLFILRGFQDMYERSPIFAVVFASVIIIHELTVLFCILAAIWFYRLPTEYAYRRKGVYTKTSTVRSSKSYMHYLQRGNVGVPANDVWERLIP